MHFDSKAYSDLFHPQSDTASAAPVGIVKPKAKEAEAEPAEETLEDTAEEPLEDSAEEPLEDSADETIDE